MADASTTTAAPRRNLRGWAAAHAKREHPRCPGPSLPLGPLVREAIDETAEAFARRMCKQAGGDWNDPDTRAEHLDAARALLEFTATLFLAKARMGVAGELRKFARTYPGPGRG